MLHFSARNIQAQEIVILLTILSEPFCLIFTYTYQIGNPKSNYRVADLNSDLIRPIAQRTPITNERKKSQQ